MPAVLIAVAWPALQACAADEGKVQDRDAVPFAVAGQRFGAVSPGAQDDYLEDGLYSEVLTNGPAVSEREARSDCVEVGGAVKDEPAQRDEEVSCETWESAELERAGDRRFFWTRYAWTTITPHDPAGVRDTVRDGQIVLFSAGLDGGALTAEWYARYDYQMIATVEVGIGPTDDGGALLAILICANGTGGCGQRFLRRTARGWTPVRATWTHQLPDELRDGFWKGTHTNPMTLQGQAGLYSRTDGNCCPSRVLYYRLRLQGDSLVLREHHVVRSPGY